MKTNIYGHATIVQFFREIQTVRRNSILINILIKCIYIEIIHNARAQEIDLCHKIGSI